MSPMVAARITNKFKAPIPLTDREGWFYMGDNASDPEARLFAGIGAVLIHTDRGQYLKLVSFRNTFHIFIKIYAITFSCKTILSPSEVSRKKLPEYKLHDYFRAIFTIFKGPKCNK